MRTRLHRPWLGMSLLLLFAAIAAVAYWSPLRIATGDSLPKGLYWLRAASSSRGSIALVCLPAPTAALGRARGYLRAGSCAGGARPVGKPVAAVAGDTISLEQGEITVNGVRIAEHLPSDVDSSGRSLSRVPDGTYEVGHGDIWLISTHHPRSWDSRFFGPISEGDIVGELLPIWVFPADSRAESTR